MAIVHACTIALVSTATVLSTGRVWGQAPPAPPPPEPQPAEPQPSQPQPAQPPPAPPPAPPYAPPPAPYPGPYGGYPPGYGPPPSYAPPPAYTPPPGAKVIVATPPCSDRPALVPNWNPDRPTPAGYHVTESFNDRLIGTGIGLLASGWAVAMLSGAIGAKVEEDDEPDLDDIEPRDWAVLYAPVVGPFVAIETVKARPSGMGLLIADGIFQVAGAAAFVAGFIDTSHELVRHDYGKTPLPLVVPVVADGGAGLGLAGRF